MARGDVVVFSGFKGDIGTKVHDLSSDTFNIAICDDTTTPTELTATPALGDFTEVGVAGTYSAGGEVLTMSWDPASADYVLSFSNSPSWAAHASNDVDAYWGIIYNDTNVGKEAIAYVDLGGPVDMTEGPLTINAGNVYTLA